MSEETKDFMRITGDDDFQGRSNSVFSCLDQLEPACKSELDSKQTRPRAPMKVPDHVLHPDKWTKYSLEDDGTERSPGMSGDALNRHVALSFMDEMRKRKDNASDLSESDSDIVMSEKHTFSKSVTKHKLLGDQVPVKSQFVEGVNVMAEYTVGKSPPKVAKVANKGQADELPSATQANPICLEHLNDKDTELDNSNKVSALPKEQQDKEKFAKRKVKSRHGLRMQKSVTEDE
ncbi:uncharacterized protein [Montipora capricornis]|uniref:uncharacterized protein n=1 Tax=Montipora capricornis TaxID=246305 RepID=UPI0035F11DE7